MNGCSVVAPTELFISPAVPSWSSDRKIPLRELSACRENGTFPDCFLIELTAPFCIVAKTKIDQKHGEDAGCSRESCMPTTVRITPSTP